MSITPDLPNVGDGNIPTKGNTSGVVIWLYIHETKGVSGFAPRAFSTIVSPKKIPSVNVVKSIILTSTFICLNYRFSFTTKQTDKLFVSWGIDII